MRFETTEIPGVISITAPVHEDERGSFNRLVDLEAFAGAGLPTVFAQVSQSRNVKCGTLRGLHYQEHPHEEDKVVSCTHGEAFDVVVDLRPDSPSYCKWLGLHLSVGRSVFVPRGCAHGFLTLTQDTDLVYFITTPHVSGAARVLRFNDPIFGIRWPRPITSINKRDLVAPNYVPRAT